MRADLMQLLDGMLVLARTEAGKSNIESNDFDLYSKLEQVVANLRLLVSQQAIRVECRYGKTLPDEFVGDRRKLRQIIDNLISNAYKFTNTGTISIIVAARAQDPGAGMMFVDFWIEDTGSGIPTGREETIFDEFVQGDLGIRAVHGGSGLGLSIVRSLCRLMGGNVEIAHTSPKGSSFHFWIRLGICGGPSSDMGPPTATFRETPLSGLHVLVAEDTALLRKLVKRLVEKAGGACTVTEDGQQAVDTYRATPFLFDAILMDVQMPCLDGIEATRCIRELEEAGKVPGRVPIVALTAHAQDSDQQHCMSAGMDDYIRKPIDRSIIVSSILRLTAKASLRAACSF
jgi:CheY-like chemotaxis protein